MTLIIAEAGVNHNGSEDLAIQLVDEAYKAGADIIKFQTFKADNLVTKDAGKADYQKNNSSEEESQHSMLSKLELSFESFKKIKKHCDKLNIEFLSTAFDSESLHFLLNDIGVKRLKIPSGEINNAPLILEHSASKLDLIVSTGMCNLEDITSALGVIAYGYIHGMCPPSKADDFKEAFESVEGQRLLKEKVTLLHCTTEYPAPLNEINLRAMKMLHEHYGLDCGYSDHSEGILVSVAASALEAKVIEKHFTLDRAMSGPDHRASLAPEELKDLVDGIRNVEVALGVDKKSPTVSEIKNIAVARKSLVALMPIKKGDNYTDKNMGCKRPGSGMSPFKYWDLLDTPAKHDSNPGGLLYD